jgi:hypothetical protein
LIGGAGPMPWQSRHKTRRDRATVITIAVVVGIGGILLVAVNLDAIGHFFSLFEVR